jgi:hypothetical protein
LDSQFEEGSRAVGEGFSLEKEVSAMLSLPVEPDFADLSILFSLDSSAAVLPTLCKAF